MATDILTPNKILSESDKQAIINQSISTQKIETVGIEILEGNGYVLAEEDRQAILNGFHLQKT